ncbi:MAG TPA: signal peptidase II [Myxococcota bacterium]
MTSFIWKNKVAWLVAIVVLGVALDQGSKLWALDALTRAATVEEIKQHADCQVTTYRNENRKLCRETPRVTQHGERIVEQEIVVVPGFFNFKYAENPAAAFSMTGSLPDWFRRPFLLLVSLLASIGIAVWYLKLKEADWAVMTAFPLIIAGAVGNLIDRARLAYVIDFLDAWVSTPRPLVTWLIKNANSNHWPTFNIADSFIVVGAALVIFRTIKPPPAATPPSAVVVDAPLAPTSSSSAEA